MAQEDVQDVLEVEAKLDGLADGVSASQVWRAVKGNTNRAVAAVAAKKARDGGGPGGSVALDDLTDVDTAGGSEGDVLTQQGDGSFALEAPSGGSQPVKIERFSADFTDYTDVSVYKNVYTPAVGEIVLAAVLDQVTAVAFSFPDAVPSGFGFGQDLGFDSPANGWIGGGSGMDPTDPTSFAGLDVKINDGNWDEPYVTIASTDPVQAGFDPAGGPFTAPTAGHFDFALLIAVVP